MEVLKPKYTKEVIKGRQTAKNIALQIRRAIAESMPAADYISSKFRGKTAFITCFNVYNYCRNNITYKKEGENLQTARTLPRILNDKNGDCKHFTTICCSILKSLGIKTQMRLISQNFYNTEPTHIYCVAYINGEEIIVDPCIKNFNSEAQYKYKYNLSL
jgi:hypothetical protein